VSGGSEGATLGAAIVLGLVGSVHCLGMCGGIAGALGQSLPGGSAQSTLLRSGLYSLGRITSYTLAGAIVGAIGHAVASVSGLGPTIRILAGVLIVCIGLHVGGWWNGLAMLERTGLGFWRRIMPLARRLGRPDRAWKVVAIGLLWGWIPCGLVYSSLVAASALGSAHSGALFMFGFGLGTLPALLFATSLATALREFMQKRTTRRGAATLLLVFGLWTVHGGLGPLVMGSGGHHDHGASLEPSRAIRPDAAPPHAH
jgi:sulfite exporter TauE/SafE